jgi:hypothetical protein
MYAGEVGVSDWKTNPNEDMPAEVRTIRCLQKLEIVRPDRSSRLSGVGKSGSTDPCLV